MLATFLAFIIVRCYYHFFTAPIQFYHLTKYNKNALLIYTISIRFRYFIHYTSYWDYIDLT